MNLEAPVVQKAEQGCRALGTAQKTETRREGIPPAKTRPTRATKSIHASNRS